MLSLASPPETPNVRTLAAWTQEEQTGIVGVTITLSQVPDGASGVIMIWKNGTLVRPSLQSVVGKTVTLAVALAAPDWVVIFYKNRVQP